MSDYKTAVPWELEPPLYWCAECEKLVDVLGDLYEFTEHSAHDRSQAPRPFAAKVLDAWPPATRRWHESLLRLRLSIVCRFGRRHLPEGGLWWHTFNGRKTPMFDRPYCDCDFPSLETIEAMRPVEPFAVGRIYNWSE